MPLTKETRKNLILALTSTLVTLVLSALLIEGFLSYRYASWRADFTENGEWFGGLSTVSDNPILMWEYRPNTQSRGIYRNIRTNRYGFRDFDYETADKPSGVYRVSFVGDSVTLGLKVNSQDMFSERFAEHASEEVSNVEIQSLNHGIDGYNTTQVFELVKTRALQFEPDKIIYVMCLNDFDFEESSGDKMLYFNKPDSFLWKEIENLYRSYTGVDFHVWHFNKNKKQVFSTLSDMDQFLSSRNIDFHVVIVPTFAFNNSNKSFADYPFTEIHSDIGQYLTDNNIGYIDLLKPFSAQNKPPEYFAKDVWHPNKEGHDFIARQTLNLLPENLTATSE
jgi:lysophospholipase L1-like esterase